MLGHLIYNYQHNDDCKIQQEISKNLYSKIFDGVHLVHCYNGKPSFKYEKCLEDKLIKIKNRGHFFGACDLINAGMDYFNRSRIENLDYVLVTAADTWILNLKFLKSLISEMQKKSMFIAASSWGQSKSPEKPRGFSTDFFVIDLKWNRENKIWPLDYDKFCQDFEDLFYLEHTQPILESAFQYKYVKYTGDRHKGSCLFWEELNARFRRLREREPVHNKKFERRQVWKKIGLYTDPADPSAKQQALIELHKNIGPNAEILKKSSNLKYFNNVI